ncbi:unnamed protein product, partial [marine sediment metagenome]
GNYLFTTTCGVNVTSDENSKLSTNVFVGVSDSDFSLDNLSDVVSTDIGFSYHNGTSSRSNIVGYVEDYIEASCLLPIAKGVNYGDRIDINSLEWKVQRNNGTALLPSYSTVDNTVWGKDKITTDLISYTQERFNRLTDTRKDSSLSFVSDDVVNNFGGIFILDAFTITRNDGGDFTAIWSVGDVVDMENNLGEVIKTFTIATVNAGNIIISKGTFDKYEFNRAYSDITFRSGAKNEYFVNPTIEGNYAFTTYQLSFPFMLRYENV